MTNSIKSALIKPFFCEGLTFLRPKLASWRYQRGNRSLVSNVDSLATNKKTTMTKHAQSEEENDDDEVPSEIEEVIDFLLQGLKDQDTVVR